MRKFRNILFVADGGPGERPALRRALALAGDHGARLTIMDVVERFSTGATDRGVIGAVASVQRSLIEKRRSDLARLLKDAAPRGRRVRASIEVGLGRPFVEIILRVIAKTHDLLIKAPRGDLSAAKLLFGSTDLHLLRKCPCPVWMVNPVRGRACARVLAAVDFDIDSRAGDGLSRKILDIAASLAARDHAELHVVHAWRLEGEELMRAGLAEMPGVHVEALAKETRQLQEKRLNELLRPYRRRGITVHFRKGSAAKVIPLIARRNRADLLVMGTVGRSGVAGLFIGNTAERILGAVRCSVLAVKPEGFVTPVGG